MNCKRSFHSTKKRKQDTNFLEFHFEIFHFPTNKNQVISTDNFYTNFEMENNKDEEETKYCRNAKQTIQHFFLFFI